MSVTADAGVDQLVSAFERVTLDGSASTSSDGLVRDYAWTQTAGTPVTLTKAGPRATFEAPGGTGTTLTFQLVVTDQNGAASTADTVQVLVTRARRLTHIGSSWVGLRRTTKLTPRFPLTQVDSIRRAVDTDEGSARFTIGARTVLVKSPQLPSRTITQLDVPLADTFGRTRNGNGWGVAAPFGGKWSCTGGAVNDADFSVADGKGKILLSTADDSRRATLGSYDLTSALAAVDVHPPVTTGTVRAGLIIGYQDISNHFRVRAVTRPTKATDDFNREVPSGWGTSSSGQQWLFTGGAEADYAVSIDERRAVHGLTAVNSSRRSYMQVGARDIDVRVMVQCSVLAAGGGITGAVMLRYKDSSNHYLARTRFGEDGKVYALLQKVSGGTTTDLGTATDSGLTYVADTWVNVRAQLVGSDLRMKVWANGEAEPEAWTVTATDTAITGTGAVGLRSYALGSTTNSLPVRVRYKAFSAEINGNTGGLTLEVHRFADSVSQLITSYTYPEDRLPVPPGQPFRMWAQQSDGQIRAGITAPGGPQPQTWDATVEDNTWEAGRVGCIASTDSTDSPTVGFTAFYATGTPVDPPVVELPWRARTLPVPFTGTITREVEAWLADALVDTSPDVVDIATSFGKSSPTVTRGVVQVRGPASYGPFATDGLGGRQEGGDLNDYMNLTWDYAGTKDTPEADQAAVRSLDCSGFVRMVFGPAGVGFRVSNGGTPDGVSIPRVSRDQALAVAPGVQIIAHTGAVPPDPALIATTLQVGDILGFDATSDPGEDEGQVDHVGIYLGLDTAGHPRFISSRKTPDGPTMSDTGGNSTLDGTGLYARAWRSARRY